MWPELNRPPSFDASQPTHQPFGEHVVIAYFAKLKEHSPTRRKTNRWKTLPRHFAKAKGLITCNS